MCCPRGSVMIKAESVSLQVHKQAACTHCTEQRGGDAEWEREVWGRAVEIRKHQSVLNQGYVEVRKPQRALLLTHLDMKHQVNMNVDRVKGGTLESVRFTVNRFLEKEE